MIRLLNIEWLKLKNYRVFWILSGMYFLGLLIILSSGMFFLEFLKSKGAEFEGIDPTILPLYDFPDVWQNITYIATFFKLFLSFIVVISVTNEITYRTIRQNIIDGLNKYEFLQSKFLLIIVLSLTGTVFLFFEGLVMGLIYSDVTGIKYILQDTQFLFAYFLEVCTYLSFALLLSLLIRKSGFVIVFLFMYTLMFEPFVTINMEHNPHLTDVMDWIIPYLPIKSLNNLTRLPFGKYIFQEIQDYVAVFDVLIVICWLIVYNGLSFLLLKKRDV